MRKHLPMILKNCWRNRRRTVLTILSIGVSLCLLGVLLAIYHAFYFSNPTPAQALRLITRNSISLARPMPQAYRNNIKRVPGVREVAIEDWFGGQYIDDRMEHNFARFAVDVIRTRKLRKEFVRDEFHVIALKDVDIEIHKGEFVALMGPSGSGKSTLLHLIAAMDTVSGGEIDVLGQNLRTMSDKQIAHWRNENVGFIFQSFNLIPVLTAIENVELPLKLTRLSKKERLEHAATALKLVGLGDRLDHFPRQLSGGQEQRVAIARAIVTDPALILADEPTGNLDAVSADEVLSMLSRLNKEFGKTIVMVTHDPHAAKFATRERHLEKGELLAEGAVAAI
jgi:putative ABC transport system ATP-binding protein